jgi:hypothetical protein
MSRTEAIERERTEVSELSTKFGLVMKDAAGESLMQRAVDLKITRTILSPPKTVVPCALEMKGLGYLDPCLIVPVSLPIELYPQHKSLAVGGQVQSISRSMYAMSPYMIDEASRTQGYWNGQPLPMLVSIRGSYKYLVKQKSFFFRYEGYVGSDIDQLSPTDPDPLNLKLDRYHWGDDLSGELTLVVAEY